MMLATRTPILHWNPGLELRIRGTLNSCSMHNSDWNPYRNAYQPQPSCTSLASIYPWDITGDSEMRTVNG